MFIQYEEIVQDALRGVVREVLARVVRDGLSGTHHFYITFLTQYPGVVIPHYLVERHPQEMTVVLQNQFWDLAVDRDAFRVTLSFSDVRETLRVPFAAITSFVDPSVKFGLQFVPDFIPEIDLEEEGFMEEIETFSSAPTRSPMGKSKAETSTKTTPEKSPNKETGAKVITLDSFRKKT